MAFLDRPPRSTQVNHQVSLNLLSLFIMLFVNACTMQPEKPDYSVDLYSLARSATYTQRELLNTQLDPTIEANEKRQKLLLASYCDLVKRRTIHAKVTPKSCGTQKPAIRHCLSEFHRCVRACKLRSAECNVCEAPAISCISQRDD